MVGANDTDSDKSRTLGDRLRESRCHARFTIREMGERLGVSNAVVNRYEHDAEGVPDGVIATYVEVTGVAAEWIRTGAGEAPLLDDGGD